MPKNLLQIQQEFTAKTSTRDKEFLNGAVFYESNDLVLLCDLSPSILTQVKTPHGEQEALLNLFVANCDYLSFSPEIVGDIIITDINQVLLDYIDKHRAILLDLYDAYVRGSKGFSQVKAELNDFYRDYAPQVLGYATNRANFLGPYHFMASEQRFCECLTAVKEKQIITLNMDLMSDKEQSRFIALINREKYQINMVNLTNVLDYDQGNQVLALIQRLPFRTDGIQPLILWNSHNRGIQQHEYMSTYEHSLFFAHSYREFRDIFLSVFPRLLARHHFNKYQFDDYQKPIFPSLLNALQRLVYQDEIKRLINKVSHENNPFKMAGFPFVTKQFKNEMLVLVEHLEEINSQSLSYNQYLYLRAHPELLSIIFDTISEYPGIDCDKIQAMIMLHHYVYSTKTVQFEDDASDSDDDYGIACTVTDIDDLFTDVQASKAPAKHEQSAVSALMTIQFAPTRRQPAELEIELVALPPRNNAHKDKPRLTSV